MLFCSIQPVPEHCNECSAGKSSFSLSSHFFATHKNFFPSCSLPAVELDHVGGGYYLAVVVKWLGNTQLSKGLGKQHMPAETDTFEYLGGICLLCI